MQPAKVPWVSQWAEMTMMASGLGNEGPSSARLFVNRFERTMFMGDPWPMKSTGIRSRPEGFPLVTMALRPIITPGTFSLCSAGLWSGLSGRISPFPCSPGGESRPEGPRDLRFRRNEEGDPEALLDGLPHRGVLRHPSHEGNPPRETHPLCHRDDPLRDAPDEPGGDVLTGGPPRPERDHLRFREHRAHARYPGGAGGREGEGAQELDGNLEGPRGVLEELPGPGGTPVVHEEIRDPPVLEDDDLRVLPSDIDDPPHPRIEEVYPPGVGGDLAHGSFGKGDGAPAVPGSPHPANLVSSDLRIGEEIAERCLGDGKEVVPGVFDPVSGDLASPEQYHLGRGGTCVYAGRDHAIISRKASTRTPICSRSESP